MKYKGGYNIRLSNPPAGEVFVPGLPERLYLCRHLPGRYFDCLKVQPGDMVSAGAVLARSGDETGMPIHAPLSGVVEAIDRQEIVLTNLSGTLEVRSDRSTGIVDTIFENGCFRYITDVWTDRIADKTRLPTLVFVRLADLDNYVMSSEVELMGSINELTGGLKLLARATSGKLLVVITKEQATLGKMIISNVGDTRSIELLTIPGRYGLDNPRLLANKLGLNAGSAVWSLPAQGALAAYHSVTCGQISSYLLLSVSGPGVKHARYYKLPVGYPISDLLKDNLAVGGSVRLINGGVMAGRQFPDWQKGLPADITGLTVLDNKPARKLLKFARFGLDDGRFDDNLSTDLQGDLRACVSCGYCQKYCPADLLPDYLHKQLYAGNLDMAEKAGLEKCVHCGICSFVCVSKIELTDQFIKAQAQLALEKSGCEAK